MPLQKTQILFFQLYKYKIIAVQTGLFSFHKTIGLGKEKNWIQNLRNADLKICDRSSKGL